MNTKVLMYSMAVNGYQWLYKPHFQGHARYAAKHGYRYQLVTKPGTTLLGMESAWLKLSLMLEALKAGYDWVIFVDADTDISDLTPRVELLEKDGKSLYVAKGHSGRINSGVLIVRNTLEVRHFFETVIANALKPLPKCDDVGWGENGHIIHFAHGKNFIEYIDPRWNNNVDPNLDDYIRHYGGGPLHKHFKPSLLNYLLYSVVHYFLELLKVCVAVFFTRPPSHFESKLNGLTQRVLSYYSAFTSEQWRKTLE